MVPALCLKRCKRVSCGSPGPYSPRDRSDACGMVRGWKWSAYAFAQRCSATCGRHRQATCLHRLGSPTAARAVPGRLPTISRGFSRRRSLWGGPLGRSQSASGQEVLARRRPWRPSRSPRPTEGAPCLGKALQQGEASSLCPIGRTTRRIASPSTSALAQLPGEHLSGTTLYFFVDAWALCWKFC